MASLIFSADKDVECLYLKWHLPKDALDPSVVGTQLAGEATYEGFKGKRVITAAGRRLDMVASE